MKPINLDSPNPPLDRRRRCLHSHPLNFHIQYSNSNRSKKSYVMKPQGKLSIKSKHGAAAPKVPACIGVIIDGNRRWAKERNLDTYEGHVAGYDKLKKFV